MSALEVSLTDVNPHYLNRVVETSKTRQVEASEDIFSSSGIKLIAKGARISQEVQERIIIHKLKRPLEQCITIENGVKMPLLQDIAEQTYALMPTLQPLLNPSSYMRSLKAIQCNTETSNLLSVQAGHDNSGLNHNVLVSMVAASLASRLNCAESMIQSVSLAALLHDIGELYIDPKYLDSSRALSLTEWQHISAHPVIGHKLVKDICRFPQEAANAIFEHHERGNGFGYPKGSLFGEQSLSGQILAAAELLVSFSGYHEYPLERGELALRIVPNEFNPEIFSVVSRAINGNKLDTNYSGNYQNDEKIHQFFLKIAYVSEALIQLEGQNKPRSSNFLRLLERAHSRFQMIQRSFSSTGLDLCRERNQCASLTENESEWVNLEMLLIIEELRWRLSELARDLSVRLSALNDEEKQLLMPLIEALHQR